MNSYVIEYLPTAYNDLIEISEYIAKTLKNPEAAIRLANKFDKAVKRLINQPYNNPLYFPSIPVRPLAGEYRKQIVDNYIMFYQVDENREIITIARVIYKRRDYMNSMR